MNTAYQQTSTKAWYCHNCGRMEDDEAHECPECCEKRVRVSRYEWFLCDALRKELERTGRQFSIVEQWELPDHRGFSWYFDLMVSVSAKHCSFKQLIEVNGDGHAAQKKYRGKGGGYTRDYDKQWEAFSVQKLHKKGFDICVVKNEKCKRAVVAWTAAELATDIINRADNWIG